jgi:hypothetical protein
MSFSSRRNILDFFNKISLLSVVIVSIIILTLLIIPLKKVYFIKMFVSSRRLILNVFI